jgi:glycine/D-amino acid oxidase-like deaminating enzyme
MYSKPVSEELQLIGLPQEVYNILPDEERNFGEAFFKKHETLFQSRLQEYTHDDIVNTISSADSYTKQKAPEIQKLQKNWILVNGFNGSGFKMYPAISEYVCKKMI